MRVKLSRRRLYFLTLQTVLALLLVVLFLRTVSITQLELQFAHASWIWILLGATIYLLSIFIRIFRFQLLFQPLRRISYATAATTSFASVFVNYVIPLRFGEIVRAWVIKRKYGVSIVAGSTVSFTDKMFDLLAVVLLLVLFAPLLMTGIFFHAFFYQLVGLAFILCSFYVLAYQQGMVEKIGIVGLRLLPKQFSAVATTIFMNILKGFSVLRVSKMRLIFLVGISFFALVLDGIYFYLLFFALGLQGLQISLFAVLIGHTLLFLSYIIPAGPGYIGNIEFFGVFVFATILGIPAQVVIPAILLHHALLTLILTIPGVISVIVLYIEFGKNMLR